MKPALERRGLPPALVQIASASCASVTAAVLRVPTDTVRHRVQVYMHPGSFAGAAQLMRDRGLAGFYSGFRPTLLRDVPEIALQFALYECLRSALATRGSKKVKTAEHLVLGGLSGATAAALTMPLDTAKTQMQCGAGRGSGAGMVQVLQHAVEERGPAALFDGMVRTATRASGRVARVPLVCTPMRRLPNGYPGACMHRCQSRVLAVHLSHLCCAAGGACNNMVLLLTQTSATADGIARRNTLRGHLQGPRVLQIALTSAIFFSAFEFSKAALKPNSQREAEDRLLSVKLYAKRRSHIWKRQFGFR